MEAKNKKQANLEAEVGKNYHAYFYVNLPMFPITNYFHGGASAALKYKGDYLCGLWYIKYQYDGNSEVYIPRDSLIPYGKKFIGLLESKDSKFSEMLFNEYLSIVKLADVLQEINYNEIKFGKIPNKADFYDSYAELFPLVIGIAYGIDMALEDYVKEKNINLHEIEISRESFIIQEERELQKISRLNDEEEKVQKLQDHAAHFSFLLSNYKGYQPIEPSYFSSRLAEVRVKKFIEKVEKIEKPRTIKDWIGFFIYIRDERKRCNLLFNAIYSRYLQRECLGCNLSYKQAVMLMPQEFEKQKKSGVLKDYKGERIIETSRKEGFIDISIEEWEMLASSAAGNKIVGTVASKGCVLGKVSVVLNNDDFEKVEEGDILVASMTRPEFAPIFKKIAAIVTNEGSVTCHAAIIARELNIPCIIGTQNATKILHDGDLVEVDADKGVVRILEKR